MTFATLVFGRAKFPVVTVTDNQVTREFTSEDARGYYDRVIAYPWEAYNREREAVSAKRTAFKAGCTVRTFDEILAEWGSGPRRFGMLKGAPPAENDEVIVDGRTHAIPPGQAEKFIDEEAARRYPDPQTPAGQRKDFDQWFKANSKEKRTWRAELITGEQVQSVELGDPSWSWGFPIAAAMRELDRLARQGWKLVHVSEDHGLYSGADANNEAYLSRVRYLLSMR